MVGIQHAQEEDEGVVGSVDYDPVENMNICSKENYLNKCRVNCDELRSQVVDY